MALPALSLCTPFDSQPAGNWRQAFFDRLNPILDELEGNSMDKLWDITHAVFNNKSQVLGELTLTLIEKRYAHLLDQEHHQCPSCERMLMARGKHKRTLQTLTGDIRLERPYFYCVRCQKGYYPLDEILSFCESTKQYDVQDLEAWLGSELPFETACEAYKRCTGNSTSTQNVHEYTNRIADELSILDVCPSKEQIEQKIQEVRDGKFRRPVAMLAIDGFHAPTRPEPSGRSEKRGEGEWREVKGFRLYLIDGQRIEHLISWHQVATDQELARDLESIKNAGLIPEDKVRLCIIGDGAKWIWNRTKEIFPSAKEVLDYYHCSQHLHAAAHAKYGKGTRQAQEWVEATLTRLFHKGITRVIAGLKSMVAKSCQAPREITDLIAYLTRNKHRVNYGKAKRGGYHIGSGAIESANKFVGNVRLKRSGAWWYPSHANNVLKLRCAKYNGTYDRVMEQYRTNDQNRLQRIRSNKTTVPSVREP
jgi:hypothetical protein